MKHYQSHVLISKCRTKALRRLAPAEMQCGRHLPGAPHVSPQLVFCPYFCLKFMEEDISLGSYLPKFLPAVKRCINIVVSYYSACSTV